MESESRGENVHHRQPDGTMLLLKRYGSGNRTLLVFPQLGESIADRFYERLAETLCEDDLAVYLVELRGHTLSQGAWTLHAYRADIAYLIGHFREKCERLYVLGIGLSASTLLEYDDQAHGMHGFFPPLPDGIVLLSPVFAGRDMLPRLHAFARVSKKLSEKHVLASVFRTKRGLRYGHATLRKEHLPAFWRELSSYELQPVRLQTPAELLVPMDEHADPLKRVFGSVSISRVSWLHHAQSGKASSAELARHLLDVKKAMSRVLSAERPIRFRALK